ncbi:MAG: hypothetical protein HYY16_10295 [Planctomycetes bacterium]|nr:hypothetical protein [Planctomycetota bacterium]
MSKGLAYFCLFLIVIAVLGVDYLVLTSSNALSKLAERELAKALPSLEYGSVTASLDGTLLLRNVGLHATKRNLRVLSADQVDVRLTRCKGQFVPQEITLVDPRLTLNREFFEEIAREPAHRPLRELYPPDALPRIHCLGGQIEIIHPSIFTWAAPQTFAIEDLALVPVDGYRYFAGGRLRSALFGEWRLTGDFDLDTGAVHLALSSDSVLFGPQVRDVLAPPIHHDWDRYQPEGPARVRVQIDADPDEAARLRATIAPAGMKLCYQGFPYPVEDARGELDFFSEGFVIKHLAGRTGNTRVRFDGRANGYAAEADFKFRLEIDSMPLDDRLRAALPPGAQKIYDQFHPRGVLDARGLVVRDYGPDKPVRNPLDIRFRESELRYLPFPYDMTGVEGEIHVDGPTCIVKHLVGLHGTGTFEVAGEMDHLDDDPRIDLRIRGQNVALDSGLKHALSDENRKLWERFSPAGAVDVDWRVLKERGAEPQHFGEATARGCRVKYADIPLPISDVTGRISYDPARVTLSHVEGRLEDGKVALDGTATVAGKDLWQHDYAIRATGARVDERFKNAMPKTIADILDTLQLTGSINFTLGFKMMGEGPTEEMHWNLHVKLLRATADTSIRFEDLEGTVDCVGSIKEGKRSGSGTITCRSGRIMKKQFTDATATFYFDGEDVHFIRIHGNAYGGTVNGSMSINSRTSELSGEFKVDRLELREFVRDTDNYANRALAGKVNVEIRNLAGRGNDSKTITGQGSMTITDGQLFEVPGVAKMLSPFSDKKRFDAGKIFFKIRERRFDIDGFGFQSEGGASIVGRGYLTFDGDYEVVLRVNPAPILGIRFFLFEGISAIVGQFMNTRLKGNLESPDVKEEEVKPN